MQRTDLSSLPCSVARALDVVGEWWTLLVIRSALSGVRRFDDFRDELGIARNVLAERLKRLVEEGILERRAYQEHPVRYEYRLTEKGRDLYPVVISLMRWGDKWTGEGEEPPVVLVDRETGRRLDPILADRETGEPIDPRKIKAQLSAAAEAAMSTRRREGLAAPR